VLFLGILSKTRFLKDVKLQDNHVNDPKSQKVLRLSTDYETVFRSLPHLRFHESGAEDLYKFNLLSIESG